MTEELTIAAVVGSLRRASFNAAVLRAARTETPVGMTIEPFDLTEVPFDNGDVGERGDPAAVASLGRAVAGADGLIVFTPERNGSVPAVTKNAIDWLSRSSGAGPLRDKPVGIVAATPGRGDAAGARSHLAVSIGANTERLFGESLGIASISRKLGADGEVNDPETRRALADWLGRFAQFVVGWASGSTEGAAG